MAAVAALLLLVITRNKGCAREDQQGQILSVDGRIIHASFINCSDKKQIIWNADGVEAGIYYYVVQIVDTEIVYGKMIKI